MGAALTTAQNLVLAIDSLEKELATMQADKSAREITITTLEAEVVGLRAELESITGKPPASITIVGSSAQPGSVTAFYELEDKVGKLGAWRLFIPGNVPSDTDVHRIKTCLDGGRHPFVSVTATTDPAKAVTFAQEFVRRVKPLGRMGTITFGHEPTQKFTDPAGYVKAKNAYYRVIREQLPNWRCIDIFMLWDIESGGDRHPDRWIADKSLLSGLGVDAYDQGKRTPAQMLSKALELADAYGLPLFLTETSTVEKPEDPNYKPNWIRALAEFCRNDPRIPTWIWFHSKVGPNAPDYGWFVTTSDAATKAFADAVSGQWHTTGQAS
jgi:hypothetical protein